MARKRDVIVAVVIAVAFLFVIAMFALMFIGLAESGGGDFQFAGLGGDVGVVEVFGLIDEYSARRAIREIDDFADGSVSAIVVHISSPGGGVAPSQEVYDAIGRAREEKPVVASMGSVAASGGLYIACAADRIVANPGTLTGSIGVIFQYHTAEGFLDKIGVETETVKSGQLKDVGSYSRRMTEDEQQMLQSVVNDTYEQFLEAVAEGRGRTTSEIKPYADGALFTGHQALNYGLVDELGGLHDAVNLAGDLADLDGDLTVVRPYRRDRSNVFDLLGGLAQDLSGEVKSKLAGPELMYLYR